MTRYNTKRRILLLLLYVVLFTTKTMAGFTVTKVSEDGFSFPVLTSNELKEVAAKINDLLQLNVLALKIGKEKKSIFENIRPAQGKSGIQSMDYNIYTNDNSIFSIAFYFETMGAYPDNGFQFLTFNAQNGDIIELNNFFTDAGFRAFENMVKEEHVKEISSQINEIFRGYQNEPNKEDSTTKQSYQDQIDVLDYLLKCCATQKIEKFYIGDKGINIAYFDGRCLPHVIQCFDIDWHVNIPFEKIAPLLCDFGKNVIESNAEELAKSHPHMQKLFYVKGIMDDKYLFTLFFDCDYYNKYDGISEGSGSYWYDKIGKSINLELVTKNRVDFELTEKNESGDVTGKFIIKYENNKYSGYWVNPSNDKRLEIRFL